MIRVWTTRKEDVKTSAQIQQIKGLTGFAAYKSLQFMGS
jgi:hypothetical protein